MSHAANSAVPYRGTLKGYLTGFVLALVLTAIPFGLVMAGTLPKSAVLVGILLAAGVQILVHLHYFLHLDASSSERWNVMALLFTTLIMAIFVAGSIWIMYNLRIRMTGDEPPAAMAGMSMPHPGNNPEIGRSAQPRPGDVARSGVRNPAGIALSNASK